jgi:hypothetical protein
VRSGDPKTDKLDLTTHCLIVFVALDESRQPRPVPRWEPRSDEDLALEKHARQLIELRGNAPHGPEGYPQSFVDRSSDVWTAAESLRLSVNPHLIA